MIMKTILHTYSFDTSKPAEKAAHQTLCDELRKTPGRGSWLKAIGTHDISAGEIELETEHLFENQWNSNKGRVFDWFEESIYNYGRKSPVCRGHYLEITDEMRAIRQTVRKCGYTGKHFGPDYPHAFNLTGNGLGSPYLKEDELHLLRLLPVCGDWHTKREPLTESEKALLLPLFIEAQKVTAKELNEAEIAEARKQAEGLIAEAEEKARKLIEKARIEREGLLWLIDRGMSVKNVIFYSHVPEWCFGWQKPFTGKARETLLESLRDFPFPYDVK